MTRQIWSFAFGLAESLDDFIAERELAASAKLSQSIKTCQLHHDA